MSLNRHNYGFELSKDPKRRAMQLTKNNTTIERANGLLANATGKERFITVGCSHTTQFCKLAMIGGITSRPKLRSEGTHRLDVEKGGNGIYRNGTGRVLRLPG